MTSLRDELTMLRRAPRAGCAARAARATLVLIMAGGCAAATAQAKAQAQATPAACAQASAPELVLALRARDARRAGQLLRCRRDLSYAPEVREAVATLFRPVDFERRLDFLGQLRRAGLRLLADFQPEYPSEWASYGPSPLRTVLLEAHAPGAGFLARGPDAAALREYPALAAAVLSSPTARRVELQPALAEALSSLLAAGLPVDFDGHRAYRLALQNWMQAEWATQRQAVGAGQSGRRWSRLFEAEAAPGSAAYWKALSERLAPREAGPRLAAYARVSEDFVKPRLQQVDALERAAHDMLKGSGLRQVADPRARLGYRETEVSAQQLQDEDMVLDMDQELAAGGWTTVRSVRARLAALETLRELLTALQG